MVKSFIAVYCFIALSSSGSFADDVAAPNAPPKWFLDEIRILTAGTGRWVTDNSGYQSNDEPYDQYGTEWHLSFDGMTMTGRLFGILEGKETDNFWEFRQYWHPQKNVAVLEQFGWGGVVGLGTAWRDGETTKSEQTFFAVDGSENVTGHVSSFPDELTHVTKSFDVDGANWTPRRDYTWHLVEKQTAH